MEHCADRPEDLLPGDGEVGPSDKQGGGLVAGAVGDLLGDSHRHGALRPRLIDGLHNLGPGASRDQGADGRRRVLPVAHLQCGDRNGEAVDQLVVDVAYGDNPASSCALLAGGPHGATDHRGNRHVEVGVREHDARVVAA